MAVNTADVMERKLIRLSQRYRALLRKHVKQGPRASLHLARGLGRQAMTIGLETLEVARIHHQILSAQEAQRKKLGRKLHDEVAQTLLGINVRLLTLKKAAKGNKAKLAKDIANTQRLVPRWS